jgi:plastocyanin
MVAVACALTWTDAAGRGVGDANCDDRVNSVDAVLVLQLTAGIVSTIACSEEADVDGSGEPNAFDAFLVLQLDAGLIDRFPHPMLREPSAYWIYCESDRCFVLAQDTACTFPPSAPPEFEMDCLSVKSGWTMTCQGTTSGGGSLSCLHSKDGVVECGNSTTEEARRTGCVNSLDPADGWNGACLAALDGSNDLECWRSDAGGLETIGCVRYPTAHQGPTVQCDWEEEESVFECVRNEPLIVCEPGAHPVPSVPQEVELSVGDYWFCGPQFQGEVCETVISAGDSVYWNFSEPGLPPNEIDHTTTECGLVCGIAVTDPKSRLWHSKEVSGVTMQFNTPGVYQYQCNTHPNLMRGTVTVQALAQP